MYFYSVIIMKLSSTPHVDMMQNKMVAYKLESTAIPL